MIAHIQTTIQTVLGVVDENGDTVKQIPVTVNVGSLKPEVFASAADELLKQKAKLVEAEKTPTA